MMVGANSALVSNNLPVKGFSMKTAHRSFLPFATLLVFLLMSNAVFAARPTIAVLDFVTTKDWVHISHDFILVKKIEDNTKFLTSDLITYLTKTNKFNVVERSRMDDILKEQDFSKSGYISEKTAVKMGELIGADYFVMGKIEQLKAEYKMEKVPYTETVRPRYEGKLVVNVRIVDSRGGKVVAAEKFETELEEHNFRDKVRGDDFIELLKDKAVREIVDGVISGVFPIKVIKIAGGEVYLNRGSGGTLKVGDKLTLFTQGESLVDPDTGENLGSAENEVATIEITAIQQKFTKARIIDGGKQVKNGMVARLSKNQGGGEERELTPGSSDKPVAW